MLPGRVITEKMSKPAGPAGRGGNSSLEPIDPSSLKQDGQEVVDETAWGMPPKKD
jgi:hypothetical protein